MIVIVILEIQVVRSIAPKYAHKYSNSQTPTQRTLQNVSGRKISITKFEVSKS